MLRSFLRKALVSNDDIKDEGKRASHSGAVIGDAQASSIPTAEQLDTRMGHDYDFSNKIVEDCKTAMRADVLNKAISLLGGLRRELPDGHAMKPIVTISLFTALLMRIAYHGCTNDIVLCAELAKMFISGSCEEVTIHSSGVDVEAHQHTFQTALDQMDEFRRSIPDSSIQEAISHHENSLQKIPSTHTARPHLLVSMSKALLWSHCKDGRPLEAETALSSLQDAKACLQAEDPLTISVLDLLFQGKWWIYVQKAELATLQEGLEYLEEVRGRDQGNKAWEEGITKLEEFRESNSMSALDEAISLFSASAALCKVPHPNRASSLHALATGYWRAYEVQGRLGDLQKAVAFQREALDLQPPPHPDRVKSLNHLVTYLRTRFEETTNSQDLEEAVSIGKEALALAPTRAERADSLSSLGNALWSKFNHEGSPPDLEDAISFHKEGLALCSPSDPDRSFFLHNLATALEARFGSKGDLTDLNGAIALFREALAMVPAPNPNRSSVLSNLANCILTRFEIKNNVADLTESIPLFQESLELRPPGHPDRIYSLMNLANGLVGRFNQTGSTIDLEKAIMLYREGVELAPTNHILRPKLLNNLASTLQVRFEQKGKPEDLEEAITTQKQALKSMSAGGSSRSGSLNNLGNALWVQFEQTGRISDLEKAITFHREALGLRPPQHPDRAQSLVALGNALRERFRRKDGLQDIEESITLHRDALALIPAPHPGRPSSLVLLAKAIQVRFEANGIVKDLDEVLAYYKEALDLRPAPIPDRSESLNSIAATLTQRFDLRGDRADLEQSFALFRDAATYETASLFSRFRIAREWAGFAKRYAHPSVLDAYRCAIELLPRLAALDMNVQQRHAVLAHSRDLARDAARSAIEAGKYDVAATFLTTGRAIFWAQALQLRTPFDDLQVVAPELAQRLRSISSELEQGSHVRYPGDYSQTRPDAQKDPVHYHILAEDWQKGVEEARRCPGFEEFLLPRSFAALQRSACNGPVVLLNASGEGCDALVVTLDDIRRVPLPGINYQMLLDLHNLIRELITGTHFSFGILERIQQDQFQPIPSQTATEVHSLPFLDKFRKDAAHRIQELEREWFPTGQAPELPFLHKLRDRVVRPLISKLHPVRREALQRTSRLKGVRVPDSDIGQTAEQRFGAILEIIWMRIVQPVITELQWKKTESPKRIWWCPTGPFVFLPIHAAGVYRHGGETDCVSEYAISSYCSTLQDLLVNDARAPVTADTGTDTTFKMLAVIQPEVSGSAWLPNTLDELAQIQQHLPEPNERYLLAHVGTSNSPTSVEEVLADLQRVEFAHFGCHGTQDTTDPLGSHLLLSGGELRITSIISSRTGGSSASAGLAYLSACETARGDGAQPDEAMSLAATMAFAGFRSVVGTMWSIYDEDAPIVADVFYGHLFRQGNRMPPDATESAYALHLAVLELRAQGKEFRSWVPFVHFGL